jgi:hypothetical protein
MRTEPTEYYAARERAERAAAQLAKCREAQKAHEEMARAYAELAQNVQQRDPQRPAA